LGDFEHPHQQAGKRQKFVRAKWVIEQTIAMRL
jgi:hypothetical protein